MTEIGSAAARVVNIDRIIYARNAIGKFCTCFKLPDSDKSFAENPARFPDSDPGGDGMKFRALESGYFLTQKLLLSQIL